MPNPNTEEWKISAYLEYVPKKTGEDVQCDRCNGKGTLGGGFKFLDDPEPCDKCFGKRTMWQRTYPKESKPKLPQELLDHMRKAYLEYKLK